MKSQLFWQMSRKQSGINMLRVKYPTTFLGILFDQNWHPGTTTFASMTLYLLYIFWMAGNHFCPPITVVGCYNRPPKYAILS